MAIVGLLTGFDTAPVDEGETGRLDTDGGPDGADGAFTEACDAGLDADGTDARDVAGETAWDDGAFAGAAPLGREWIWPWARVSNFERREAIETW